MKRASDRTWHVDVQDLDRRIFRVSRRSDLITGLLFNTRRQAPRHIERNGSHPWPRCTTVSLCGRVHTQRTVSLWSHVTAIQICYYCAVALRRTEAAQ